MQKTTFKLLVVNAIILFHFGAGLRQSFAGSVLLSKRINIQVQNQSLEQILHLVEDKASVQLMYNPRMINIKRKISLQLQNTSVQDILQFAINNKDLVFFEMGNYIVITSRKDAPKQANLISAAPTVHYNNDPPRQILFDTVKVFDTLVIIDTNRVWVHDTIKVYDTIFKEVKRPTPLPSTANATENKSFFTEYLLAPIYSDMLPANHWLSDLSLSARASFGCKWNNLYLSIGIGALWQRGGVINTKISSTSDSILQKDTVWLMQRYKKGDYWYLNGTDTVRQILYDSSLVAVPRQWYKTTQHQSSTETSIGYSIVWLTIPCKIGYEWVYSRKTTLGIGVGLSPSFAVKTEGFMYDASTDNAVAISSLGLKGFALMLSIEPSISYSITKHKLSIYSCNQSLSKFTFITISILCWHWCILRDSMEFLIFFLW